MKLFLATGNKHKIEEIKAIFQENELEIYSILDGISIPEVLEDGKTFEENSQKKALEIAKYLNMMAIADDSGLCVDALGGAPGVYSARYSEEGTDEANNQKLLRNLQGIENRRAKFVSVISFAKPNGDVFSFRGEVEGEIIDERRGQFGFGYDPYFYVKEYGKTLAEMPEVKNQISHRAEALKKFQEFWRKHRDFR
ncbi:MAG: XTP/dITP diphosphatase [Fusobacterium necrophorum]|nr:XTP/dITP diphosphatase [Fusobacterium necrophorum]MDY2572494.1 XTP/dITP diphosphatase [Fusobacterium necrophorum]MDY6171931.1 XTP/dITP diphosphatase [Fusobacterium necrophorum]